MKPHRIAIRISGTNAELSWIARPFATRYASDSPATRAVSRSSAVNALIVAMPPRLFARVPLSTPTWSRTAR